MEPSSRYRNIATARLWFHVLDSIATPGLLFQKALKFQDEGLRIDGASPKNKGPAGPVFNDPPVAPIAA
jgi:hypothetical protein